MVFQNYLAEMPTPEEQLNAKKEELKTEIDNYNAIQQAQQVKMQGLLKLQGAVDALQELVPSDPE